MHDSPEDRLVGAVVAGKYRVRRVIGAGSMGTVCEAEHVEIGKRVALKLIDASLAGLSDVAQRFRQEARAANIVQSQHIVQVFDVGTDDDVGLYLVMEYLTGEDLAHRLAREGRLEIDDAVRIAVQSARGLARAHEGGVIHRDLKPANLFLCERDDGEPLVKILDFGISKVVDASRAESRLRLTRAGTVVGTPQYMSPEQAQGLAVDERTDVWALGLVTYEMLAGRPAYPELPTYEQFIIHLVQSPPDPLREVAPWVPAALAEAVHGALQHDLRARTSGCVELAKSLLAAHPLEGVQAPSVARLSAAATWADGTQSPFAEERTAVDATVVESGTPSAGLRAVPDRRQADVDVPDPTPTFNAASEHSAVARSGVREPAAETAQEEGEDAPQFFDRRSLRRLAVAPAPSSPSQSGEVPVVAVPRRDPEPPAAPSSRRASGVPVVWAAVAFVTVGLLVAVALAMR